MLVTKRDGTYQKLDIAKIQKNTIPACLGLDGTNSSELEVDSHIKFINNMETENIAFNLIQTAVDKIDIDRPNWTFVAARLFLYDLYHRVGKKIGSKKGSSYGHLKDYLTYGIAKEKIIDTIMDGYDVEDLNNYIKPERDNLFNYLGIKTMFDRYLIKDSDGKCIELPQHMFMAIAMFLAQNEKDKQKKAIEFYNVISKFEVMLATPTLSNARTYRHQLSSCYIGSAPDNIEGIFDSYKEMALLSKFGGGIGWDWNNLRALGSEIDKNKGASSGYVPFLKINNDVMVGVNQLGTRAGAAAVYTEPWHKDVKDFLDLKKNSGEERRRTHELFPALWINDLFMQRVKEDGDWTLMDPYDVPDLSKLYGKAFEERYTHYEKELPESKKEVIKAKDLWKKVLTEYFETGNPFLTYKDTANRANPNKHVGTIRSSNLCTEIFQNSSPDEYKIKIYVNGGKHFLLADENETIYLTNDRQKKAKKVTALDTMEPSYYFYHSVDRLDTRDYAEFHTDEENKVYCVEKERIEGETAVCNLASVNLARVNTKEDIERVVPIAIRMLDNVIDLNFYPLKKVKNTNLATRGIGLGVMGEAEMLAVNKILFGTQEHFNKIDNIMEAISYNVIKTSSLLGIEKGNYPKFEGSLWNKGIFPVDHIKDAVKELTTSDSLYNSYTVEEWDKLRLDASNNMRNGYLMAIAPTSSISILVGTTQAIEPVYKKKWFEENKSGLIPAVVPQLSPDTWEYYPSAYDVDQLDIIRAGAIRQKWIDQGQSLNIFIRLDKAKAKYLNDIYILGWELGLKSNYYLRSQSADSSKAEDVADRSIECAGCQ